MPEDTASPVKFIAVGAANTVVSLSVIYALKGLLAAGDVTANAVGYAIGLLISFAINRKWTFKYRGEHWGAALRFLSVIAIGYLINLVTVLAATARFHVNGYVAQAFGVVPYTAFTYWGCRHFAFASRA